MKKRTKPSKSTSASSPARPRPLVASDSTGEPSTAAKTPPIPGPRVRWLLATLACFHLLAVFLSFTTMEGASSMQSGLSRALQFYLQPTHFGADDKPVYLTHAESSEQPHRLQISEQPLSGIGELGDDGWKSAWPETTAGLSVSDRRARFLATAAMLAEQEQSGLVAELLLPFANELPTAEAIRILRLPTDLSELNEQAEPVYVARIVRAADSVSLVQLQPTRLSAVAETKESADE